MAGSDEIGASRKALGRQLAAYRKAAGYSQHDLAPLTHYARSTIANVEVGRQNVPRSFWTICDELLQAEGALTRGSDGLNSLIQRQRRDVTGYVAAIGTLGDESSGPHDTSDMTDPPYFLPDGIGRLMRAMLHPAADDKAPPDVTDLSERVLRAWQLRQSANYAELADHLTLLIPDIEHAIASTRDETQQAHTRLAVHAYNAASSLLKRLGGADLALLAADRAARAAADLDDAILSVAASYRVANVLLSAARLDGSRQVALRAADAIAPGRSTTPLSLASWGGLLLTAAVATARGGSESSAWELLGEARTASRLLATDYADVHTIFGPTNVAIHAVQVAVELGDGKTAVERARGIRLDRLPTSLTERRGQLLIDLAHAHSLVRNDADAVVTLQRALRAAPQEVSYSHQAHGVVRRLLHRERASATPGLRKLAARVGVAL